jgi:Mn2+/Fe2+ NRAMP family transporter
MAMTMFIGTSRTIMGQFAISGMLKIVGWIATAVMGAAAIGMITASVSS